MRMAAAVLFTTGLMAQTKVPGLVRGDLIECETSAGGAGELSVRTASHQVFRFRFDRQTYFERDRARSSAAGLDKGDLVEVVADRAEEPVLRYARTVHVLDRQPAGRPPVSQGRYRAYRTSTDRIVPMGDLTFAGVVGRVRDGRLVLRTRADGEKTILLRQDTRYLEDGLEVSPGTLKNDTRVFIRGAKNFEGDIEAYQVIWGRILDPSPRD